MAVAETTLAEPTAALPAWNPVRQTIRATMLLGGREVRLALRTPMYLLPNLVVPIFFYFIMLGSLKDFANQAGLANWEGFLLPMSLIFAVQGGSAGLNMVADIESGYFDKLLLTPANRLALLVGAMLADFFRIMAQALIVLLVAVIAGLHFETGIPGALVMVALASCFGLAYSGIGFTMALRTGNAQATQSMWFLFMPFMFLTTMFAPKEALSGWLSTAATVNPMTYVLQGLRSLSMEGWDASDLLVCMLTITVWAGLSIGAAFLALRSRVR
jgi:ABC-2 type transport system permease protein